MKEIRKQIDKIDKEIFKLLKKRLKLMPKLAKLKKTEDLPIQDKKRESKMLEKFEKIANKEGVSPSFVKKVWANIFKESRRVQEDN